ncbi:MAG: hypothetical protein NZ750_00240 [Anaerolineae bacterium]|nr:hypothetical protein [Anaerolineae bacterium]MDW8171948.1 hypothetical protein [Anaerolineae bacterium]
MTIASRCARLLVVVLRIFVSCLPALLVVGILHFRYGTNIYEHVPVWNDEVGYWHQAATFAAVGFRGGYYSYNENVARATWTRFDVHGPWYPMLYGTLGLLLGGWELHTPIIINLLLYTLSIAVFIHTVTPSSVQLLVLALVLATMHPIILYLPTGMSEGMQAAFAMLLAAIFWRLLRQREQVKPWQLVAYGAFLWIVTVTRLSWGVLLLPFFLLVFPFNVRGVGLALLMTALSAGTAYAVVDWVTPGQSIHSVFHTLSAFTISFDEGLHALTHRLGVNWERYISPNKRPVDVLLTQQFWTVGGILLLSLASAIVSFIRKTSKATRIFHLLFNLYNLLLVLLSSLFLYIMGRFGDYRVIGIHLLVTLALLATFRHYLAPLAFVLMTFMGLAAVGTDADTHRFYGTSRFTALSSVKAIDIPKEVIFYDPNAKSPWCNTLLMEIPLYTVHATRIPSGIGLSWVYSLNDINTIQSQYVWLTDESIEQRQAEALGFKLSPLFDMPMGMIYLNEASACL